MPITGTQATAARNVAGYGADDWPLQQLIEAINGRFGLPFVLTGLNNSELYVLTVKQNDAVNGYIARFQKADGEIILAVTQAAVTLTAALSGTTGHFTGQLDTDGNLIVDGTALISGATTIDDSLDVNVNLNVDGTAVISGATTIDDSLDVNVNLNVDGTSTVQGTSTLNGAVTIDDNLVVTGTSTVAGDKVAVIANGDYTGNGGSTARQITLGFKCEYVHITNTTSDATAYTLTKTDGAIRQNLGGATDWVTAVHLHATDGFTVADGATSGNNNNEIYHYVAFG